MPRGVRSLDDGDDVVVAFAVELRALRERAGQPPYRELARRAHYSAGTLSDAAGGRKLPSLAVTLAYVRACDGDVDEWERRWHETAAELAAATNIEPDVREVPYVGLTVFQAQDAARFRGRETLVEKIVARLRTQRFVAVFGASGVGKSSVLRAGVIPALRAANGLVVLCTPGAHPLEECAIQLARLSKDSAVTIRAELAADPGNFALRAQQALAEDARLVLVVDQFEEVFTVCQDAAERDQFIDALRAAAHAPSGRIRVVLGLRTDFYTHCARHPALAEALAASEANVLVGPMNAEQLRRAIVEPASGAGYTVDGALLARVLADAANQPGALPLISHALRETWRRRAGNRLTVSGYEAAGGIEYAIAQTAESVYTELDAAGQRIARDLFLRLTAPGEGTEDTKRRITRRELDTDDSTTELAIARLVQARLLVADEDVIEIAHEALIRHWPRLQEWLAADREGLRVHRGLTIATDTWESLDHDPATLYRGIRLDQATSWAAGDRVLLTTRERQFLQASVDARAQEEANDRRRNRRLRRLVAAVVVFGLIASAAAGLAIQQRSSAVSQRDDALFAQVVAEADRLASTDPALSAQLDLVAHRMRPDDTDLYTRLIATENVPLATPLIAHRGEVYLTSFSPNGHVLATASEDRTVRLWDVSDPTRPTPLGPPLTGHTSWVSAAVFSPDGRTLATTSDDGLVQLWNVADPARPRLLEPPLEGHDGTIYLAAFSPDGKVLATANGDHTVRLWNVADPAHATPLGPPLTGHTAPVRSLAFSPDGHLLAEAGDDTTILLWDIDNPAAPVIVGAPLTGHTNIVHSLAFSPDSRILASGSEDHTIRLWNVSDPAHVTAMGQPLVGHTGGVWSVAFDPDGDILASGSQDGTARLWNVSDPADPVALGPPLTGSSGPVYAVGFSPDGRTLASGEDDGVVRLWSLPATMLVGQHAEVNAVAFSRGGGTIVTGASDNTTALWNIATPTRPALLRQLAGPAGYVPSCSQCLNDVSVSPDGRTLATLSDDKVVELWDIRNQGDPTPLGTPLPLDTRYSSLLSFSPNGRVLVTARDDDTAELWNVADLAHPTVLATLAGHTSYLSSAVFSPDGRTLATASSDHTVRLWDVTNPARPTLRNVIRGHTSAVNAVAFSPDGHTLATGGADQTIWLWNVTDPAHPTPAGPALTGIAKDVTAVAFSPDGHTLASGSTDQTIRLWNITDLAHPSAIGQPMSSFGGSGYVVAFSPNGRFLVSADAANTVHLTDLDLADAIDRVCTVTHGVLTAAQWQLHLPDLPYQPPCAGTGDAP